MTIQEITKLQKANGSWETQELINSGLVWKMEGSMGRHAMSLLEMGACYLPKEPKTDYYGNRVPSRDWLEAGSKGTLENTINYYSNIDY